MTLPDDWLDQLRQLYPKRDGGQGWHKLTRLIPAAMSKGAQWGRILEGTRRYRIWCGRKGNTGTEFVMMASSFYGRDQHWEEWADYDLRTPQEAALDARWGDLRIRAAKVGLTIDSALELTSETVRVVLAEEEAMRRQWRERGLDRPKFGVVK